MQFKYKLKDKIVFYWKYFILKIFYLWFEVKTPKVKMFVYELLYSAKKFIDRSSLLPSPFKEDFVETRFGKFRIRPHTVDMSNVSPAFERRDVDYLLNLIRHLKEQDRKILFMDIGADIGTFSVTVGNQFKNYKNLHIIAFEPAESSYSILKENLRINNLQDKVEIYRLALFSEDNREIDFHFNPDAPGSSGLKFPDSPLASQKVTTKTLDSVLNGKAEAFDVLILKMDVEGVETEVIKGGKNILNAGKDIYLLVEDFINPAIIEYLETINAEFICKLTPYNSWWRILSSVS
jgi:FkbM family methyltransferase